MKKNNYYIIGGLLVLGGLILSYRAKAALFAKRWVGISEKGVNISFSDAVFEDMMRKVGWKSGEEWCMYFVKAIHLQSFPQKKDLINKILTGSTQRSWKNAKADTTNTYKIITEGKPKLGDIAIWQRVDAPDKGHAGIVTKSGTNTFKTIEGNTNAAGSSAGNRVAIKDRPLKYNEQIPGSKLKLLGFIRKKF